MRIAVLGPVEVENGPQLPSRDRIVLAALVVSMGSVCPADRLAAALYGDDVPPTWRKVVQGTVVRLRRALGAAAIQTTSDGYRLVLADDEVDLSRMERLLERAHGHLLAGDADRAVVSATEALALFRGDPLVELDGWPPGRAAAARIGELRNLAEDRLLEGLVSTGRAAEAVAYGERLVRDQPLREQRWVLLALAQYRSGRQGEALRSISRARRVLADELGVSPGPDLERVEQQILAHSPELASASLVQTAPSAMCPYRGLAAYGIQDAGLFFGRDREAAECLKRLRAVGFLAIVGPSGSGKSSLARAGVAATLASAGRALATMSPGSDPERALADVDASAGPYVALVVDQLEELFTQCDDESARQRFADAIVRRVAVAPVIVTLRADHLADVTRLGELAGWIEKGIFLLGTLADEALREAIVEPAGRAGLRLEPGLLELAVRDVTGRPGSLPMLSHAMAATWERREAGMLTTAGYEAGGGVNGAVATTAESVVAGLSPAGLRVAHDLLLRLVLVDTSNEAARRRLDRGDLPDDSESNLVLDALVRARLVTADAGTIEITHEAMVNAWPRLHDWLVEDREGQAMMEHLARATSGWVASGRDDAELYRGTRLQRTQEWVTDSQPTLTAAEQEFLERSRRRHQNEQDTLAEEAHRQKLANTRLRRLLAAAAILIVIALIAGITAVTQRRSATQARDLAAHNALVNSAVALRGSRRDLAALLAVQAHRLGPSAATEDALFGLFTAFQGIGRAGVFKDGELLNGNGVLLPDNATLVGADDHGVVRLIDLATGVDRAHLGSPGEQSDSAELAVTADGRHLAVANDISIDGPLETRAERSTVSVWDLKTGTAVFEGVEVPITVGSVAISSDGSLVAVGGGYHGRTLILDGRSGKLLRELPALPRPEDGHAYRLNTVKLAFTADGRLIVTSQAGPIRIIDPHTGAEFSRIDGYPQTAEGYLALSADEHWMITSGREGMARYELSSGRPTWAAPVGLVCQGGMGLVESIGIALCGERGGRLVSVDVATGAVLSRSFESVHGNSNVLAGRTSSTMLVFSGTEYTTWRTDGSSLVNTVIARSSPPHVAGYTADGKGLILVDSESVEVVDAGTGAVTDHIPGAIDARPSDDPHRIVASFADGTIGWYDVAAHARTGTAVDPGFAIDGFTASPGGALVWSHEGPVADLDLERGTVRNPGLRLDPALSNISVSPDGSVYTGTIGDSAFQRRTGTSLDVQAQSDALPDPTLFVAGNDLLVVSSFSGEHQVLDASSLKPTDRQLPFTRGFFTDMVLDTSGRRLLALGADNEVRLYDLATRTQIGGGITFDASGPPAGFERRGIALRPDGLQAAVPTKQGVAIWDLDPDHWVAAACELAGRNLTKQEWATYIGDLAEYRPTCPQFP